MISACLSALLVFAQTPTSAESAAPAPPHKPNRSGEPALRQLMATMSSLKGAKITDFISRRMRDEDALQPETTNTIWFQTTSRFRILQSDVFGGGRLYVSDGKTLLVDTLDDTEDVVLAKAGRDIP